MFLKTLVVKASTPRFLQFQRDKKRQQALKLTNEIPQTFPKKFNIKVFLCHLQELSLEFTAKKEKKILISLNYSN